MRLYLLLNYAFNSYFIANICAFVFRQLQPPGGRKLCKKKFLFRHLAHFPPHKHPHLRPSPSYLGCWQTADRLSSSLQLMEEFKEAHRKMFAHKEDEISSTKPVSTRQQLTKTAQAFISDDFPGHKTIAISFLRRCDLAAACLTIRGCPVFHLAE